MSFDPTNNIESIATAYLHSRECAVLTATHRILAPWFECCRRKNSESNKYYRTIQIHMIYNCQLLTAIAHRMWMMGTGTWIDEREREKKREISSNRSDMLEREREEQRRVGRMNIGDNCLYDVIFSLSPFHSHLLWTGQRGARINPAFFIVILTLCLSWNNDDRWETLLELNYLISKGQIHPYVAAISRSRLHKWFCSRISHCTRSSLGTLKKSRLGLVRVKRPAC